MLHPSNQHASDFGTVARCYAKSDAYNRADGQHEKPVPRSNVHNPVEAIVWQEAKYVNFVQASQGSVLVEAAIRN
jgi:hypothetical protein